LQGANLSQANLRKARLEHSNLSQTNLSGANLSGADLSGADLSGANLSEANLREANITDEQLSGVRSLSGTIMPDGARRTVDLSAKDQPRGKRKPDVDRLAAAADRLRKKQQQDPE
jgi:uncharacterized protein YjbI with pentapeptide repeats